MSSDNSSAPAQNHDAPLLRTPLLRTPLHALHGELGARMAGFAGYDMPIQYPAGVLAEHKWTRECAGLFDVSHMGQALLEGPDAAQAIETLVAADVAGLGANRTRYAQFLNDDGGVLDDLMITRLAPDPSGGERLLLVVNAARKAADFALLRANLPALRLTVLDARALLALCLGPWIPWAGVERRGGTCETGGPAGISAPGEREWEAGANGGSRGRAW